jgi:Skp family chaperone for outer membrane proteins
MNPSRFARYGWVLVLLALGALWLRVESGSLHHRATAAPRLPTAEELPLPPTTTAVIDVAVIFKGFRAFNEKMADIKQEIEDFDRHVKERTLELKELGDQLAKLKPGSAEEKDLRARAEFEAKALQDRVTAKKAELLQSEAETYYVCYEKLQVAVRTVARKRKIDIVIRFNSEEMKRDDRNSVLQGVNRAVIYYPETHDITSAVLATLNQS